MVTLAKLCLVMTVVLGLAFASPHPTWSRNQDTGDKVFKVGVSVRIPNALSSSGDLENEGEKPGLPSRSASGAPTLKCPEEDWNLSGADIEMEGDIESWSDCGRMCIVKKTCKYWTWDEVGQKCYLKSGFTAGTNYDRMISGKRGCVE